MSSYSRFFKNFYYSNGFDNACSGEHRGGLGGLHEPPLGPKYFSFMGNL